MKGLGAIALLWLVAGCTTTSTINNVPAPPPSGEVRDRTGTAPDVSDTRRRADVRLELASGYYGRGQYDVALEQIKLAITNDPNNAAAYNLRGLIYAQLGDEPQADESFRRALQVNPRDGDTMHNYAWFHCQRKRYAEATALFDQALALPVYSGGTRTLLAKGVCQAFDQKYVEAERTLSRAQQFEPANPSIGTNLAEVLYRLGAFERARATIQRVNSLPGVANAQTLWLAARIERRLGNAQGVAQFGRRLRSDFPAAPETEAFEQGRFSD